jgi:UDP-N-acetylmuramate--alanine ligase
LDLVVYTEAIPHDQEEFQRAQELGIEMQKYNIALSKIANHRKLVAICGTHGKSTTSSLISLILKNSEIDFLSVVGTLLKEF